jgi:uncharacterized protein with GYD domain
MGFGLQKFLKGVNMGVLLLVVAAGAQAAPDIRQLTSEKIRTLQVQSEIVAENREELQKIGGDFANFYRLQRGARTMVMTYAQPNKLHFAATVLHTGIAYTINGNSRLTSVPLLHVHKVEDITGAPGKRQTLLDSGVVPPEQLLDYNGTFLRQENGLYVFQLLAKLKSEPFKDIVWIDPKTHITVKRQHFDRDGKLVAWYLYKNPVLVAPGIYFPTRVEVYNPENRLGGVTVYKNIRVNQPVDMSVFNI